MGNSSNLKIVTITHPHPCVNYFTLLSHNECGFLEGAKLTALKSTEQVLQRHQQSQFSLCTSIFLSHCGLTIKQSQLCPESRYNLPSLRIFCSFPMQKCPSYVDFFFLGISWMKEALIVVLGMDWVGSETGFLLLLGLPSKLPWRDAPVGILHSHYLYSAPLQTNLRNQVFWAIKSASLTATSFTE